MSCDVVMDTIELRADEIDLVGAWVTLDGVALADPVTRRIEELIAHKLERVASAEAGWTTLYRDPRDGRYWEHTYPHCAWHGGGPPRLTAVSAADVVSRYGV